MPIEPVNCENGIPQILLNCETDSVTICPGEEPIVVEATDLDIRNLDYTTDSVTNWPEMENVPSFSSTIPLGANASFDPGNWINVERVADIRVGVLTDQPGDLRTQHSFDGISVIRDSHQPVMANKAEFLSFHPRGRFFRVVYDNGSDAQTSFNLSTEVSAGIYGVTQSLFSAPLGRTSFGVQARSVLYDYQFDESAIITPFIRDLVTVNRASLFADAFNGASIDTMLWETTAAGSGSTTAVAGFGINIATGITADSTVKFNSRIVGRFIAGNFQSSRSGIYMPDAGTVNNKRRWGPYDDQNGFFWELDGTILYAVGRIGGVDSRVPSTSWNKVNTFELDPNSVHSYEVGYFADTAWFVLDGEVVHLMGGGLGLRGSYPNSFENINSGGSTANVELYVLGSFNQRYGPNFQQPRFANIVGAATTLLKNQPGHIYRLNVNAGSGVNTATLYDNTIAAGPTIATLDVNKVAGTIEFGIDFSTGLTIVTTGAATDITVVFD